MLSDLELLTSLDCVGHTNLLYHVSGEEIIPAAGTAAPSHVACVAMPECPAELMSSVCSLLYIFRSPLGGS